MIYTITLNSDNPQALAFVEFAKTFDFLKVTPKKESKKIFIKPEELEEDEDGIPIKYRDEIMAMSKESNRNIAKRLDAELAKRIYQKYYFL